MIKLAPANTFHGPSPYGAGPLLQFELWAEGDLQFDGHRAWETLRGQYPNWSLPDPTCDAADPELALARLAAGWALHALNEVRGFLFEAGARRETEGVRVWLGFHDPAVTIDALRLGLTTALAAGQGSFKAETAQAGLEQLWQACRNRHPDFQARILMTGARKAGIPFLPFIPGTKFWQFGWGANGRVFMETSSNADGQFGVQWQHNKAAAKGLLALLGLPTPRYVLINGPGELEGAARAVGYPCAVKPLARGGGKGVTAGIQEFAALKAAFAHARAQGPDPVMVEAHVAGIDHRLMVIDGRFIAAIRREASFVIGDGQRSVAELIEALNAQRSANLRSSRYLRPIAFDSALHEHLSGQNLTTDSVPPARKRVTLRSNANLSTGGLCTDVTDAIHPQVVAMAEQLANTLGLYCAGIDYLTTDIALSPAESGGAIIEANATPGLDVCVAGGWDEEKLALLVLGGNLGAIPVELRIVAADALDACLRELRNSTPPEGEGWVCGQESHIGPLDLQIASGEPWAAVAAALRNRSLRRLRIVCSDEQIMRSGLPLPHFDRVEFGEADLPPDWQDAIERSLAPLKPA